MVHKRNLLRWLVRGVKVILKALGSADARRRYTGNTHLGEDPIQPLDEPGVAALQGNQVGGILRHILKYWLVAVGANELGDVRVPENTK